MTTETAPVGKTVTLAYAVVTVEERSVNVPLICPKGVCGADLMAEQAITETWLVHCDFGGSIVIDQSEQTAYRNGYVYSKYGDGFATIDFRCASCGTSLLP